MIVGTAGHIDHGKTTLVRALTGVDTDRLPEEKSRGISIELGYAFLDVPGEAGQRIGFVDVPGHERLVHTMLAGATGIDLALLLVAADDGVMPQTREHLAVLSLLGIDRGAVVITKPDRVDAARLAAVRHEIDALTPASGLAGAPRFEVSAVRGDGLPDLRAWLFDQALAPPATARDPSLAFRMAIDRCFTLEGTGTVVTGTVHAGRVGPGDALWVVPGASPLRVRARSVHVGNRDAASALAGQRCAVALPGTAKESIARGQWLVAPGAALGSDRIDLRLTLWHAEARPLRSGTPVHVHLGAGSALASVAVLNDEGLLVPGQTGWAQLVLRRPLAAWRGDRVVLRDASASRTVAGGQVMDPQAPARYRRTPERLAALQACAAPSPGERLTGLLAASPQGLDVQAWCRAEGRDGLAGEALPRDALVARKGEVPVFALSARAAAAARSAVLAAVAERHRRAPEVMGLAVTTLRRQALPRLAEPLWRVLLAELLDAGQLRLQGAWLQLPEHRARLSATDTRIAEKMAPLLSSAGFGGMALTDLALHTGEPPLLLRSALSRLAQCGVVHPLTKDLFISHAAMRELAAIALQVAQAHAGDIAAAKFRDAAGIGRRRSIQILEYFDRAGLLRRVGDVHRATDGMALFRDMPPPRVA